MLQLANFIAVLYNLDIVEGNARILARTTSYMEVLQESECDVIAVYDMHLQMTDWRLNDIWYLP